MTEFLKLILSLSLSGSILAGLILLLRAPLNQKINRRFFYYLWLLVLIRLVVPFSPSFGLTGLLFQYPAAAYNSTRNHQTAPATGSADKKGNLSDFNLPESSGSNPTGGKTDRLFRLPFLPKTDALMTAALLVWLFAAVGLFIRKVTAYQSFYRYVKAGKKEVDDPEILDLLSDICEDLAIKKPLELYLNPLVSSPLLMGVLRPCIILPYIPADQEQLAFILRHEAVHYQCRDGLYNWFVQAVLCLHWFNPLIHRLSALIRKDRELACDERVIRSLGDSCKFTYGNALLQSIGTAGSYKESLAAVTLHENSGELKQRLEAIACYKNYSDTMMRLGILLAGFLVIIGYLLGAYRIPPRTAAEQPPEYSETVSITPPEPAPGSEQRRLSFADSPVQALDLQSQYVYFQIISGDNPGVEIGAAIPDSAICQLNDGTFTYRDPADYAENPNIHTQADKTITITLSARDVISPSITIDASDTSISIADITAGEILLSGEDQSCRLTNVTAENLTATFEYSDLTAEDCIITDTLSISGNTTDFEIIGGQAAVLHLAPDSGEGSVQNFLAETAITIDSQLSDLHLESVTTSELTLNSGSGTSILKDLQVETAQITNEADLSLQASTFGSLELKQGYTSSTIEDCTISNTLNLEAEMGTIIYNGVIAGAVTLTSRNLGKIRLTTSAPRADWQLDAKCSYPDTLATFLVDRTTTPYPYQDDHGIYDLIIMDYNSVGQFIELNFQ